MSGSRFSLSMFEVPEAGKYHRHIVLVAEVDGVLIFDRAAWVHEFELHIEVRRNSLDHSIEPDDGGVANHFEHVLVDHGLPISPPFKESKASDKAS